MILNICDNSNILNIIRYAKIVIDVIKIAVPIILILVISIRYMSAITKKDEDLLAKANKSVIRNALAAVLVFLIPTFVSIGLQLSNPEPDTPFYCIKNATMGNIINAAAKESEELIAQAKKSLSMSDYSAAKSLVNGMPNSAQKTQLENELNTVYGYIKIKEAINGLKTSNDNKQYEQIQKAIEEVKDPEVKKELEKLLEEAGKGMPINETPGTHQASSGNLTYYVNIPEKATTNMPLIMYLHGDGGNSQAPNSPLYSAAKKHFGNNFPFIIVAPAGGMWAETSGRLSELKGIIDTVCQKYSCDKTKISITGHSRGSIGTWHMVNNYPGFFFAAVPVSCGSYSINPSNFVGTKVKAFAGTSGEAEAYYNSQMRSNVSKIQRAGGDATFVNLAGHNHGSSIGAAYTQETLLFMIQ